MIKNFDNDLIIEKAKTCAFTGHRKLQIDFEVKKLEEEVIKLIELGYENFLVGMALGFDTVCFNLLKKLKINYNIKIIACMPCLDQDKSFTFLQKQDYEKMVNSADYRILISEHYTKFCMHKRNRFMVDNCSRLIAYLREDKGGTASTVKYAESKNVKTIII